MQQILASPAVTVDAMRTSATRRTIGWALLLMAASGFAALGYQVVWIQQSTLWLGHEAAALLAVIAAFFGGIAVGALALGPRIDASSNPVRWYAACEAVIGLWSLALALLMSPVARLLLNAIGPQPAAMWHWTIAFCGTFLLLLPATAAMGATLPAMERILAHTQQTKSSIAVLYASNTLGAVLGTLGTAFVLVPTFGLKATAGICAATNLLCALVTLRIFVGPVAIGPTRPQVHGRGRLALLAASGFLGIGYEVLVVRALSQIAENTVYTFAILLAVYLIGTAIGAAAYGRWLVSGGDEDRLRNRLSQALCVACLAGALALAGAEMIETLMAHVLGNGMASALAGETALAICAFLPPTIVMGALFSHLSTQARGAGISFGRALGANTIGAALAPLAFGVILTPSLGTRLALLSVCACYLLLASRRAWLTPSHWATVGATAAMLIWAPSLAVVAVPAGGRLVSHIEGATASVSVVENAQGVASLHINNRQQEGSNATVFADARQALLPVLLHPDPKRALFLGLGTGITARAAAQDNRLEVHAVELLPEVIAASKYFTSAFEQPVPRLHVFAADARRFVRATSNRYDVIVSDNFHPARSGSGTLYTTEHFAAVRDRLNANGVFCQWLPLHQLDLQTLRSIVRSFQSAYPRSWAMLATNSLDTPVLGLVARRDGESFGIEQVRTRLTRANSIHSPAAFGLVDDLSLLGSFVAGPEALTRFAGSAPHNTDDHPIVIYSAPRITYAPDSSPRDRLLRLLHEVDIGPDELLSSGAHIEWQRRLASYWLARTAYIELGHRVRPTADVRRMLAQVHEPLVAILRISPEFRPAYDPLLNMAIELAPIDGFAARQLLIELARAQPARTEAAEALRRLSGNSPAS